MISSIAKVFIPAASAFIIGILITPFFTHFFYKYKLWKKSARKEDAGLSKSDEISPAFKLIHNEAEEIKTPRPGGVIVWVSILITTLIVFIISKILPTSATLKLDFLSRGQTLLPFFALIAGSLIGLVDDLLSVFSKDGMFRNGFPRKWMIAIVSIVGIVSGLWFYNKLGIASIHIPFAGDVYLGVLIIPLFLLVFLGTFSSGVIDGIDGLAAGVLISIFAAFGTIAYFKDLIDLAAFCGAIVGALLAFLWFNIPPARFYLGETGMMGLVFALPIIVFFTDSVFVFLIIALPLVVTSLSSFIQIISKKMRGPIKGKVFLIAPLHHHFEALGWPRPKITMRYWVIAVMCAVVGVILAMIS